MKKTNVRALTNPDYMGAYSMDDGNYGYIEIPAILKRIEQKEVTDPTGKKKMAIVGYTDQPKPFILNKHSQKVCGQLAKSGYKEDWVNLPIVFYVAPNKSPQGMVDALWIKQGKSIAPIVDYSKQEAVLLTCTTLDDLKAVYTSFTKSEQIATVATKNQRKNELSTN